MSLFKNANFRWFITGNVVSHIGSGITMIGVPWYLVMQDGGEQLLGIVTFISTLILFFAYPYAGVLVDRFPRVQLHRIFDFLGFLFMLGFGVLGFFIEGYSAVHLTGLYLISIIYYMFHYPTVDALSQELFSKEYYGKVNSIMEIQGQGAAVIAGALASVLISVFGLSMILIFDAITFLITFLLYGFISYQPIVKKKERQNRVTIFSDMIEGWNFLKQEPLAIIFFLATTLPFVVVQVLNYVTPIYIAYTLQAEASVYASHELIYALGAVLAGFTISFLNEKAGTLPTIYLTIGLYTLAVLIMAYKPSVVIFLLVSVMIGWGNAGTRINRKTIMMNLVPNEIIGRINSFYQAVGVALRLLLIGLFTISIQTIGASAAVAILGGILCMALIGVFISRNIYIQRETASKKVVLPKQAK
ncbi:MAG: MFS transporter [Bacillaceae bacterium]|nr:MFS transporter [Bacillaceae bacterium]